MSETGTDTIAHLVVAVSSSQVSDAEAKLAKLGLESKRVEDQMGKTSKASDGLMGMLSKLAASIGLTTLAYQGFAKLLNTAKEFESLEAQLKTATGSAEGASVAFAAITDFATQTPYDLKQTTEAFISLVNLGLNPSERALRAYGNTSSAMGRDLSEMINAVSKATVGEFMPLRSFGIKAQQDADGIKFTFRGVSEVVKNTTKDIENYFIKLGETNFAGSMDERMATLEGRLSNLGDAWDQMFYRISKAGAGDLMKEGIALAQSAIEELTAMIASGELSNYIEGIAIKFRGWGEAASTATNFIVGIWNKGMSDVNSDTNTVTGFIVGAFARLPENVTAVVKGIGATFGVLVEYALAVGRGVYDAIVGYFKFAWETSKGVATLIWELAKNPLSSAGALSEFIVKQADASKQFSTTVRKAWDDTTTGIQNATDAYGEVVTEIMNERDATIKASNDKIAAAKAERAAYEARNVASAAGSKGKDRLAPFSKGTDTQQITSEQRLRYESLLISLSAEEDAVALSYAKRKKIIEEGTMAGSEAQAKAMQLLNDRRDKEMVQASQDHISRLHDEYAAEQRVLANALIAKQISEQQFQDKSRANWEKYETAVGQISKGGAMQLKVTHLQMQADVLGMASNLAGQLENLVQGNNAAAKTMFIIAKGIAIAQAIVNTELAATKALAEGGMYAGIPMSTIIRAMGYASVGVMIAQDIMEYKGKFATGGYIPAGAYGITDEAGPEAKITQGPTMVMSARATADHGLVQRGNTGAQVTVNVINQTGASVTTQERSTPDGRVIDVLVKHVENRLTASVMSGGTPLSRAIENSFGLNRANTK